MVKLYTWSDCCGEWQFYGEYIDTQAVADLIKERRWNPKYCRTTPPTPTDGPANPKQTTIEVE